MYTEVKNVWESSAKSSQEAKSLQLRAQIMIVIRQLIRKNGWNQSEAAKQLGISQPRVSFIINGQVSKFTTDKLLGLLGTIGYDLDFSLKDGVPSLDIQQVA